jgi:hypothetical protein
VTVAVVLGRPDQPLDLIPGQVFAGPDVGILGPAWGNCSIFSGWSDQLQMRLCDEFTPLHACYCTKNRPFMNSQNRIISSQLSLLPSLLDSALEVFGVGGLASVMWS